MGETIIYSSQESERFYAGIFSSLINAGFPGEFATSKIAKIIETEEENPEDIRAYRLLAEEYVGRIIYYSLFKDEDA